MLVIHELIPLYIQVPKSNIRVFGNTVPVVLIGDPENEEMEGFREAFERGFDWPLHS